MSEQCQIRRICVKRPLHHQSLAPPGYYEICYEICCQSRISKSRSRLGLRTLGSPTWQGIPQAIARFAVRFVAKVASTNLVVGWGLGLEDAAPGQVLARDPPGYCEICCEICCQSRISKSRSRLGLRPRGCCSWASADKFRVAPGQVLTSLGSLSFWRNVPLFSLVR